MKIVYITRTVFGALGTSASYMLPTCMSETNEVIVLAPNDPESGETVVYQNEQINVVDTYHSDYMQRVANGAEILLEFQPDIIHLFYHKECHQYPVMLRHLLPKTSWVVDFRSPLMIFQSGSYSREMLRQKAFLVQLFVDGITATSIPILRTHLPFKLKPFFQLPFGIDLDEFEYKEFKELAPGRAKRFVFTGNIAKARRIDLLVRGFAKYVREHDAYATLDIYGTGNAMKVVKSLIRKEKMDNIIRLKGVIPQSELFKKLGEFDAGIAYVPHEQLGAAPSLKALEFAAAGLPVLASDTLGHRKIIRDDGFDFSLFENSAKGIKKVLRKFTENGASKELMYRNYNAVSRYDWHTIVNNDLLPAYNYLKR